MKSRLRAAILIVGLAQLLGCEEASKDSGHVPAQTTPSVQTESPHPEAHRFVLAEHHTDVAFDTLTGQLCTNYHEGIDRTRDQQKSNCRIQKIAYPENRVP
jgi:hypothetical protein